MKYVLYYLYALIFYLFRIFPLNYNKTTFIMTHDSSINGNIMRMYREVLKNKPKHICKFITKNQINNSNNLKKMFYLLKFLFITPYYLATSKTIFLDNVFLPMAYMKFNKNVNIVQLWHGCNTIKKFGQLTNKGKIKVLEKKSNSRYTHVIVSSKNMIKLHNQAFGVNKDKFYSLGLPRLDLFFNQEEIIQEKKKFYSQFPYLKEKNIILYAPTFRDNKIDKFDDNMNLSDIAEELPDNYIIVNKFHPFVSNNYGKIENRKMIDMSDYEDLTRILLVSDMLITDYSSIIFEYMLLKKPIIFYSYDKNDYENNIRGFYYNYDKYVKSYVTNKENLKKSILNYKKEPFNINIDWIEYNDCQSSKRIYDKIYK